MAAFGEDLYPEELRDPDWWNEEVLPVFMRPIRSFPYVLRNGLIALWITDVRTMNFSVVDDAFMWHPSLFALVIRREVEVEDEMFVGPLQVKIHIVFTLEHAMDIISKYLFPEDACYLQ